MTMPPERASVTRGGRPLIFLIVLMSHAVMLVLVIREGRLVFLPKGAHEPLLLMLLLGETPAIHTEPTPPAKGSRPHTPKHERVPENAITAPPDVPPRSHIDWQHEAALASQSFLANAEKEKNYRDLSGLSAAQRDWIKQNQMKPAPPGIAWQHPRFEFDRQTGLPMFWINDRCVWIMLMVFCGVGHAEADGGLFNHLRDLHEP
jgi:hypothetical protein